METLKSNVNKMNSYPSKDTMETFLYIGNKLDLFQTAKFATSEMYKDIKGVTALALVVDYINQTGKEDEKKEFLDIINSGDKDTYKALGKKALDIRLQNTDSKFSKALIKANREKIDSSTNQRYFPVIDLELLPSWYGDTSYKHIIHKEFEGELARLKGIKDGADKIQSETKNHKFDRGDNSKQISELENKL